MRHPGAIRDLSVKCRRARGTLPFGTGRSCAAGYAIPSFRLFGFGRRASIVCQAISKTIAGGETSVLDPGGFGALSITKSISITNEGVGDSRAGRQPGGNHRRRAQRNCCQRSVQDDRAAALNRSTSRR